MSDVCTNKISQSFKYQIVSNFAVVLVFGKSIGFEE